MRDPLSMADERKPSGGGHSYKKIRPGGRIFAEQEKTAGQRPMPPLLIPGICPSQSAGRFHGMVESDFGATQPARRDPRATASNATSRGFLAAFMGGRLSDNRRNVQQVLPEVEPRTGRRSETARVTVRPGRSKWIPTKAPSGSSSPSSPGWPQGVRAP